MAKMYRLIVRHARQIVTVCNRKQEVLCGTAMNDITVLGEGSSTSEGSGFTLVVDANGCIAAVGTDEELSKTYDDSLADNVIDASGMSVVPGLIDGHTHPVWTGDRVHEFKMKIAGATYMDIHAAGGGIQFTVDWVRKSSIEELYDSLKERLHAMMRAGTTFVEAKSGYGLDAENEVKMLTVIEMARKSLDFIDISATFCGAHSIPRGKTMEEATDDVINVQLPAVKRLMDEGKLHVDNIDVFCEKGVFEVDATRKILIAGREAGLAINFHGDELHPMESGTLGAEVGARAISHLEELSDTGIEAMATKSVIGVVLPTTAYILHLKHPPVRKMIEAGVPVALGTDFNPNAYCLSMPLAMNLACVLFRMTLNEALAAATINAAASIGKSHHYGSLEPGKIADLLILKTPRWEHLVYQMGNQSELIKFVVKRGKVVHEN